MQCANLRLFHDEFLRTKKLKSHWIAIDTPLATTNPSEDLFIHRIKRITIENIYIYYDKDDQLDNLFISKKEKSKRRNKHKKKQLRLLF